MYSICTVLINRGWQAVVPLGLLTTGIQTAVIGELLYILTRLIIVYYANSSDYYGSIKSYIDVVTHGMCAVQ